MFGVRSPTSDVIFGNRMSCFWCKREAMVEVGLSKDESKVNKNELNQSLGAYAAVTG